MQKNLKKNENYCPDRTYGNNAKRGAIKMVAKTNTKIKRFNDSEVAYVAKVVKTKKGYSFVKDLLSTRWTSRGAEIVVTKQPNTSEEAYMLAKQLQSKLAEELIKHNRFINNYDEFLKWFAEKEEILKDNGFHKRKG